ncbi:MAG: ABC transporter permease [Candidatus Bathyarchaeia archaeon]
MKKRKMRTSLTLFTVATICFSMVSFTSMSIITSPRATKRSLEYINYNGIYIRKSVWGAPAQTFSPLLYYDLYYDILEEIKSNNAVISPRIWIYPSMTKIPICYNNEVSLNLRFLIGLTPKEKDISFIDIKYGYWFAEDGSDANICIINENLALQLGIDPEKIAKGEKVCVNIWGLPFRIVGIVDTNMLSLIINPDAEAGGFMPAEIGGYEGTHASPDSIVIIPFGTAMRILGGGYINSLGGIFNIVIKFSNITQDQILNYVTNLCYRFSLQIYAVYNGTVWFYTMYTAPVFFGWESLLVVFLISALIILSTMLGNVEERKREIQIYGTIGLNPLHVGGIFLAESLVYSIIGSVFGYFSGITIVLTINNFQGPVLPANFSSIFVVLAVLIAITTMICSSGYAVWLASKMTTPSIERRWRPPTKPRGDEWLIPLPFRFSEKELWGLFAYLIEYIEQHRYERIGYFQALDLRYKEELHEKTEERGLVMKVKLAPWDLPTFQLVNLRAIRYLDEETYQIFLHIIRESGFLETWMTSNYVFISDLRKQLLLWRSLSPNEKKAYVDIGARKLKLLYSGELDEKP